MPMVKVVVYLTLLRTIKAITKEDTIEGIELTPIVKSLKGTFKAPKNIDYKKELSKRLTEKYL